jgi:Plasmid encoded RepA protein
MGKLLEEYDKARKQKTTTPDDNLLIPLGNILDQAGARPTGPQLKATTRLLKPLSRVQARLLQPCPEQDELCFQHSVLCQTGLPYRNPPEHVRVWQRQQGNVTLVIEAGQMPDPATRQYAQVALPYGPKPRLILAHLNAEALRQGSPTIEIEATLSAFVKRIQGSNANGREIKLFKDQLRCLSAATIRLAIFSGNRALGVNTHIIQAFELWLEKDPRQRVLWQPTIQLSREYFESLQKHAVPLNESDLAALAHTAMGLDIYAWLAQRLHRVDPRRPTFIPWPALKDQFGAEYERLDHFRPPFRKALGQVQERYQTARIELDKRGLTARNSPPPVSRRLFVVR